MASLAKAYCHHQMMLLNSSCSIPFQHYRPSNLQNPISLFALTSPSISPSDPSYPPPHHHHPRKHPHQFGHFIIPSMAVAASAWFFFRLHRNPPIITGGPVVDFHLELEEEGVIRELPLDRKPGYVKALHFFKIKPGAILKLLDVYESSDNYASLKARIRVSAEWLETARKELEEVVGRDPGRVMGYSKVVDELMELLRDMEVYIDKCEKENLNNKGYLRSCYRLLARVRRMEAQILNVLEQFQEEDQGGGGEGDGEP